MEQDSGTKKIARIDRMDTNCEQNQEPLPNVQNTGSSASNESNGSMTKHLAAKPVDSTANGATSSLQAKGGYMSYSAALGYASYSPPVGEIEQPDVISVATTAIEVIGLMMP